MLRDLKLVGSSDFELMGCAQSHKSKADSDELHDGWNGEETLPPFAQLSGCEKCHFMRGACCITGLLIIGGDPECGATNLRQTL